VTPPSTKDKDGKAVKGKAYDYGCPACRKETLFGGGQTPSKIEQGAKRST
jgi:hypothetical protein